jgi:hypothetical protein
VGHGTSLDKSRHQQHRNGGPQQLDIHTYIEGRPCMALGFFRKFLKIFYAGAFLEGG